MKQHAKTAEELPGPSLSSKTDMGKCRLQGSVGSAFLSLLIHCSAATCPDENQGSTGMVKYQPPPVTFIHLVINLCNQSEALQVLLSLKNTSDTVNTQMGFSQEERHF